MSSFSTSLSGLDAEEQALSVISNDLSNLNTTAFKTETPVFSDLFYQMLGTDGAGDPVEIGVGSTMSSVSAPITQGNISSTGVPTDVAIQGNGLFIVDQNGTQVYTRAGDFTLNTKGNLTDANGNDVLGYTAVNGTISTGQSLSPIVISLGESFSPSATSNVQLDMNLDAADTSLTAATGSLTVSAPTLPASGQTAIIGGTTYTFVTSASNLTSADTVLVGSDVATTLANLAGAIDASTSNGQAAGTTYGTGTVANNSVSAAATATALNLTATAVGTSGNSLSSSSAWTAGSFTASDLTGGVNDKQATGTLSVPAPLPTAGETVAIGGTTYTFANSISSTSPADTVLIGSDVALTLANLAGAVNASSASGQAAGTTYSSSTVANTVVRAAGTTSTALTLQAITAGASGDQDGTITGWTGSAFTTGSDLTGGADAISASATLTVPTGVVPTAGQTIAIGGTTYTFAGTLNSNSPADTVLIDPSGSVQTTLSNLMAAINGDSTQAGTAYSTATANTEVAASNATSTSLTLKATTSEAGTQGDTITVSSSGWNTSAAVFKVSQLSGGSSSTKASAVLTASALAAEPSQGDTVSIGSTTYTFVTALTTAADEVLIDPSSITNTLTHLEEAINVGANSGSDYSSSTVIANKYLSASAPVGSTLTLTALNNGTGYNSVAVLTSWSNTEFGGSALAAGVDAVAATGSLSVALPTPQAGQTVTVGGTTYTFASSLAGAPADTVLIDSTSVQNTLSNLMAAVNADASKAGTAYSSATANTAAVASNATGSALTLTAIAQGTAGNSSVATSTSWTGGSFAGTQLSGALTR